MEITISKRYLKIPVSYLGEVYHFKLSAGEGAEYSFDAAYAEKAADTVYYADLREFLGQTVSMTIDPPVLLKPEYCDQPEPVKEDPMRPMAHFSAPRGWMNDPNGLCCYEGTYHLFYQHNPYGRTWGNMHWGHAVSKDLFHWEHCQEALLSDGDGVIFSGSALIDYRNASGLKTGQNAPILFYYTRVGKTHDQCLAVSTDGGLTLTKYERPVLPAMTSENRDPKVIFDQARSRYLMALYMEESRYALFVSENLLDWRLLQEIELPGDNECPDIYPLQAEDGGEYWILSGAHDKYYVGIFDEEGYYSPVQEIGQLSYDSEGYAAQTYFYEKGKPVIRFTWDRSNIPGTSYNGSMCFPMEMGLVKRKGSYFADHK